jgi:molybdenum cofactor cytidylyltransferase
MDGSAHHTVGAVVLGAGTSSRFGDENKLLVSVSGTPMLARVVRTVRQSSVDDGVVVLGHEAERVPETLAAFPIATVTNKEYATGQSTSVRRGIEFAVSADWDAVVVLLGDMPFLRPDTVDRLVQAYRAGTGPIIAPQHDGQRGHPVVFDRSLFDRLLAVTGDRGGRELVRDHPETVLLDTEDPGVRRDVDTSGDLADDRP